MLSKSQLEAYAKELEARQRASEAALEQAKANLNAVSGARQAVAELLAMLKETEKNASSTVQQDASSKEVPIEKN